MPTWGLAPQLVFLLVIFPGFAARPVMGLVFAFAFLPAKGPTRPDGPRFATAKYNQMVDEAVADIRKGGYTEALPKLEAADAKRSDLAAARLLAVEDQVPGQGRLKR